MLEKKQIQQLERSKESLNSFESLVLSHFFEDIESELLVIRRDTQLDIEDAVTRFLDMTSLDIPMLSRIKSKIDCTLYIEVNVSRMLETHIFLTRKLESSEVDSLIKLRKSLNTIDLSYSEKNNWVKLKARTQGRL